MKKFILCLALVASLNTAALASVLLGSWENATDGWIDWSNAESIDSTTNSAYYEYSTIGATNGSSSLNLTKSGWNQSLSLKLTYSERVAFVANTTFSIDVTVPADVVDDGDSSGYAQIYNVTINAEGYGWHDQFTVTPALNFYFWNGSSQRTATLVLDYSAILSSLSGVPGYIEIIITTNSSSTRGEFYFDNAVLTPEPATLALLGLGLTMLRKRSK